MDTDDLVRAIAEWLAERYPGDAPRSAAFTLASGRTVPLDLPVVVPTPKRPSRQDDEEEERIPRLWYDVIDVLEEAGKPMKREAIYKRLMASGREHGESTLYKAVPRMLEKGWLKKTADGFLPGESPGE